MNLNSLNICNGTRLRVQVLYRNANVEDTVLTGSVKGGSVFIPLIPPGYPFDFKRLQFLLKVYFVMTINKSQRKPLKLAGADFRENCFHMDLMLHALYFVFVRVRQKEISNFSTDAFSFSHIVSNCK